MADTVSTDVLGLTAQIVAAHVGHNQVAADALPALIQSVYRSLATVENPQEETAALQAPAVPVKKSVFPDFIICLEDGKKLKMLKRHLKTSFNMSPAEYRLKWSLPQDYPMVAPAYASHRSNLAKSSGLGRKPGTNQALEAARLTETPPPAEQDAVASKPPKARSRHKAPIAHTEE